MSVLIIFIKLIAVFDLLVIAVYFGGDILSTMLNKLRRKAKQEDSFDFSQDAVMVSLSIDSVRQLYSGDAADFVEDKILPNQPKIKYTLDFDVTPHQLRHTYITNLLYAGVDPKTVQYLAGHENSKTTMDIYAKVKYNKPEELFGVVNGAFHQPVAE